MGLGFQTNGKAADEQDTPDKKWGAVEYHINHGFNPAPMDYYNQGNAEIRQQWNNGEKAKAVGTALRKSAGYLGRVVGDAVETGLGTTAFPAIENTIEFSKGLFGGGDAAQKPIPQASPQAAPAPITNQTASEPKPTYQNPYEAAQQQAAKAAQAASANGFDANLAAVKAASEAAENKAATRVPAAQRTNTQSEAKAIGFQPLEKPQSASTPFVASFGDEDKPQLTREQRNLLSEALSPIAGARGLTANQVRNAQSILAQAQNSSDARERAQMQLDADAAKQQANNDTALQREYMQQAATLQRSAMDNANRAAMQDASIANSNAQFNAQMADKQYARQPETEQQQLRNQAAAQLQNLNNAYLKAETDEERANLARQINALNGRFDTGGNARGFDNNRFMKIQREVAGKDGMTTQQDDIIDLSTGRSILNGGSGGFQAVGKTKDGRTVYRGADGKNYVDD